MPSSIEHIYRGEDGSQFPRFESPHVGQWLTRLTEKTPDELATRSRRDIIELLSQSFARRVVDEDLAISAAEFVHRGDKRAFDKANDEILANDAVCRTYLDMQLKRQPLKPAAVRRRVKNAREESDGSVRMSIHYAVLHEVLHRVINVAEETRTRAVELCSSEWERRMFVAHAEKAVPPTLTAEEATHGPSNLDAWATSALDSTTFLHGIQKYFLRQCPHSCDGKDFYTECMHDRDVEHFSTLLSFRNGFLRKQFESILTRFVRKEWEIFLRRTGGQAE